MNFPPYITSENIHHFISEALKEDVGDGDHSTLAAVPADTEKKARLLVKEDCVLAGIEMAKMIFHHYDKNLEIEVFMKDGDHAKVGDVAFHVKGNAQSILTTERLVLNTMQRMSGIATHTHELNQLIEGTGAKLLDTRKTTPNFRLCEKWAVVIGGGINHRYGLYDMVMLKDNHIDYCGSITQAVSKTKKYLEEHNKNLRIEVETRNLEEVKEALNANVDRIMLDNMSPELMKEAVSIIQGKCETEASGGITRQTIRAAALSGVDYISVGALTHSSQNKDLSLKALS
ncbi:nicotinate-nucleotide diphosphorylase (carboxylating) [Flavobacteriaceae bacterium UJ101]|nr:nicotinate-nucleotide diphosphorylase (carboxylating) [Flavobacteriaceae bacterium UJ101]